MTSSRRQRPRKSRAAPRSLAKGATVGSVGKVGKAGSYKAGGAPSRPAGRGKLVSETKPIGSDAEKRFAKKHDAWLLQDAKARFSELVRRVKAEGPQRVSVRGKVEVVVVSEDDFRRLKGERTGAALIEAMQASPSRSVDLTPTRIAMPVRTVEL